MMNEWKIGVAEILLATQDWLPPAKARSVADE
jgi:hypothetical protein